jgi:VCBS repeat-containing protein
VIDGLRYDVAKTDADGTLYLSSTSGAYVFVANADQLNSLSQPTTDGFTVTVSTGSQSASQLLAIAIAATNDTPILAAPATIHLTDTAARDSFANQTGSLSGSDAEHGPLSYGIAGAGTDGGTTIGGLRYDVEQTGETGTLYLSSTTGQYVFVPEADTINALSSDYTESFTFTLSDGRLTTSQTLNLAIKATNDAPILATPDPIHLTDTAARDSFANQAGSLKASDAEYSTLSYGIQGGTAGGHTVVDGIRYDVAKTDRTGTLYLSSTTGEYVFVPNADAINALNHDTTVTFTVSASDGSLATDRALVITITATPDLPALLAHAAEPPPPPAHGESGLLISGLHGETPVPGEHYRSLILGPDGPPRPASDAAAWDGHAHTLISHALISHAGNPWLADSRFPDHGLMPGGHDGAPGLADAGPGHGV